MGFQVLPDEMIIFIRGELEAKGKERWSKQTCTAWGGGQGLQRWNKGVGGYRAARG